MSKEQFISLNGQLLQACVVLPFRYDFGNTLSFLSISFLSDMDLPLL